MSRNRNYESGLDPEGDFRIKYGSVNTLREVHEKSLAPQERHLSLFIKKKDLSSWWAYREVVFAKSSS